MAKVIGIDLGPPTPAWRLWRAGIPLSSRTLKEGGPLLPWSLLPRAGSGWWAKPPSAKRDQPSQHGLFHQAVHGRKYDEVQEELKRVPYKVVRTANGDAAVEVEVDGKPKVFSPPENLGHDPGQLRADARCGWERRSLRRSLRSRLFQRFPTSGHQGRRPDRRPGSAPDHQ